MSERTPPSSSYSNLHAAAIRLVIANRALQKAIAHGDLDEADCQGKNVLITLEDVESALLVLQCNDDGDSLQTSIESTLAQMRRRTSHN